MMDQTALTVIEGDARIADTHLQQVLGYARINDLHRIIRKHEDELADYGPMLCRTGKASSGQTTIAYYPNEAQATLICMFARTGRAAQARKLNRFEKMIRPQGFCAESALQAFVLVTPYLVRAASGKR